VLLPGILSLPAWYKQLIEFMGAFGIQIPSDVGGYFVPENMSTGDMLIIGSGIWGYLLAVPVTAFLAKRGLFIGRDPNRICFPGGQAGAGIYSKERDILSSVGLRAREAPTDLWLLGVAFVVSLLLQILTWRYLTAWVQSFGRTGESQLLIQTIVLSVLLAALFFVVPLRRRKAGRA